MSKGLYFKMREEEVAHLLTEVEQGNSNALSTYANLKRCKDLFDEASKQVEPLAFDEALNFPEKTFNANGFTFEKRNGATRYSYNHIPKVQELKAEIKEIESKSKQAFLSQQKGIIVADENGEEIILPKVSYSKDVLVVKNATEER